MSLEARARSVRRGIYVGGIFSISLECNGKDPVEIMRLIALADVHGYHEVYEWLVDLVEAEEADAVVVAGDLQNGSTKWFRFADLAHTWNPGRNFRKVRKPGTHLEPIRSDYSR